MQLLDNLKRVFGTRTKSLEILYLLKDLKPVVRHGYYDAELGRVKEFCQKNGLAIEISPYKVVLADPHKQYSDKGFKVRAEDPRRGMFFTYISKDQQKAAMADAFEYKNDHRGLGLLLGYPDCCVSFFIDNYPERSRLDNDYVIPALKNSKAVRFPYFNNILKRHVDINLLSHFPHSFECEESKEIAKRRMRLIAELDPSMAMHFAKELKGRFEIQSRHAEFF